MQSFDVIEQSVIKAVRSACNKSYATDEYTNVWTRNIQEALGKLGRARGYGTCASLDNDSEREWLFDVTWYEYDQNNSLLSIPFIAEMEWGLSYQGIKFDFEKLIQSTALRKTMIFENKNENTAKKYMEQLSNLASNYKSRVPHDRYILISYVWETHEIITWQHSF